ncbi:DnaB-like helicase N-terminal domain-containing protein [Micromonospora sp. NPDC047548]|uniref:DnaB-like helicase N-terminal domain-containing protein n=1 Tax=Micromonospora sp. NPDC047548 TaxID=3155624 RepID=UPI0033F5E60B
MAIDHPNPTAVDPVVEAERFILGTALTEIDHTPGADHLTPGDFYLPRHGAIWRTIQDARAAGEPVDPVAVGERLRLAGDLQRAGGMAYLTDCTSAAIGPGTVAHHAGIIAAVARRRARHQLLARAAQIVDDDERWEEHGPAILTQLGDQAAGRPATGGERDSWQPVDLGPYLRGEVARPEPTVGVRRRDGLRFIYPGKEHSVIGEMEAGKSWFALASVAAELDQGHTVVYVHFEEADPSDTIERLQALGVHDDDIAGRFRFVAPARAVTETQMARLIADPAPSLVILDGVNEGMAMHAAGIRDEDGVALFRRLLITPFIRSGCAVLTCDHVVKDRENRGRYALGSIHKGNALSGALILLENADPFGRGARGRSHVYVTKDRPGHLRRHGRGTKTSGKTFMGEMIVDDTRTHVSYLDLAILPPAEPTEPTEQDTERGAQLADAILTVIGAQPDQHVSSERTLFAVLRAAGWQVRDAVVKDTVDDLIVGGRLAETIGRRGAKGYRVVATAAQDPESESES